MSKKLYSFRLPEELVDEARKNGEKEQRDLTNVIEHALTEFNAEALQRRKYFSKLRERKK